MEAFGWTTQFPSAPCPPSCPSDDALAFLSAGFELHSDDGGNDTVSSDAYDLDLPSSQDDLSLLRCQDGVTLPSDASAAFMDSVDMLPAIAGAHDWLLDRFWFPNVHEEPARAAVSNTAFSGYSSTTGGGNISSGESNTYGRHDTEVASPCDVSQQVRPAQTALPPCKRKLADKYPAAGASASATMTAAEAAAERRSTKRAAATTLTSITFGRIGGQPGPLGHGYEPDTEALAQVKEMIYREAAMRPVNLGAAEPRPEKPRRKNVRISNDPQTAAARLRRERVSERLRALQRLVPGGSKMDTASMLDEAASYLKFLKSQLEALETLGSGSGNNGRLLQHYMGRNPSSVSNGTVLAFGRDGITGYVKSNRNKQL